jgi:hypothetical protein
MISRLAEIKAQAEAEHDGGEDQQQGLTHAREPVTIGHDIF